MIDTNGYQLSRAWFDFCFENPELISPSHTAIYFFAIEHCNRLGWKSKFGFPTQMTMDALGIKKHQTYIRYFNDLCEWGFIKLVQRSMNQYSSNIISLQIARPKNGKALDKAFITHAAKQTESTGQSKDSIDKPITNNHLNQEQITSAAIARVWLDDEMEKAWDEWKAFRKEIKKTLKPSTEKKQIEFLRARGPDAVAIINQSITNGWTGLFDLKKQNHVNNGKHNKTTVRRADATIEQPDDYGKF